MAFGGTGGGFSFGSNNSNTGNAFGGFGSTSNTSAGFGSTTNTGFGSTSTTANSNPFGGSTFGSNTGAGGFGTSTNSGTTSLFGNKPATTPFGSNTSGGTLFGNTANTTSNAGGFGSGGGFGATGNSTGFGANNNSSSFNFGPKTTSSFGQTQSSGTGLFGAGGSGTTGGFGSTNAFSNSASGTALNQNVPPSNGTAGTPFNPTVENDIGTTNKSSYQSITFQEPYNKYSFEELRLADYNAGRRFGNGSGQAGAFGSSTFGGGGFGSGTTAGTGFGGGNTAFGGTSNTASTSFGSSLFGNNNAANKSAGGLFGQQSSGTSGGGLFGTSNNNNTSFGSGGTTAFGGSNTGSNLFGSTQNQAPKPAGGLFGNTATTSSGFSFGGGNTSTTGSGGGLFGSTTSNAGGGFGTNNQQQGQQQSGGLFGGNGSFGNTQNQSKPLFGGGGGFGNSATQGQASGGLFGNTSTQSAGGGLFGNTSQTNNSNQGGLFGNTASNTSSGLFGSNNQQQQNKPAPLFGSSFGNTANSNTDGGLFNSSQTNNQQGGGLFGNNSNSGGLFGNSNNNASKPGGLFGSTSTNQNSGGLFSSTNTGGGMFGTSQNNMQNALQQQDGPKHASQLDNSPYTKSSIWTGLPEATPQSSAPLLTPLSSSTRLKESASKPPALRLQSSRYNTPPTRRLGYGFTYSTYGTPNSAASTPGNGGLSTSMYNGRGFTGGSFGRSLHKSFSSSALRPQYNGESENILSPGAFAPGSSRYSSGSIRRLTIDRSLRTDLFSRPSQPALPAPPAPAPTKTNSTQSSTPANINNGEPATEQPGKLKKRVSFDKDVTNGTQDNNLNGETGALVRTESDEEDTPPRRGRTANGSAPEMEQVRGRERELAAVPEDREPEHTVSKMRLPSDAQAKADPTPGDYYMKPSRQEMSKMTRQQLGSFRNFEVGRKGCGRVIFNDPVDLTSIPLDDIYDKIVEIRLRQVTVYPDASSKPPVGRGLNVPSTLYIENSWPRARNQPSSATSGPIYDKHINRLKRMQGTDFISYDPPTGVWTFMVPHYTRYGLDYDDDEEMEGTSLPFDAVEPETPQLSSGEGSEMSSGDEGSDSADDTFAFKQKTVPGGFGRQSMIEYEHASEDDSAPEDTQMSEDELPGNDIAMAGTYPQLEPPILSPTKSILRPRMGTPGRPLLELDGDWADQLQRTISPRKQNRETLREAQNKIILDRVYEPIKPQRKVSEFRNSIDLMNSLFGQSDQAKMANKKHEMAGPEFEVVDACVRGSRMISNITTFPYSKRLKLFEDDMTEMSSADKAFHASFKPKWTGTGALLQTRELHNSSDNTWDWHDAQMVSTGPLRLSQLNGDAKDPLPLLHASLSNVDVDVVDDVPFAKHKNVSFSSRAKQLRSNPQLKSTDNYESEQMIYDLAHVLFDDYDDHFTAGLSSQQKLTFDSRIRKDRLTSFLSSLIWKRLGSRIREVEKTNPENAAILHLAAINVKGACQALKQAKNFHLMMLVAQITQADKTSQDAIHTQLEAWRDQKIISEISEPIRALYEILAGNTTVSHGYASGPVEDRASTFQIADRFGLDWLQSFGLGLCYGKCKNDPVEKAVRLFAENVSSQEVPAPRPYRVSSGDQESPLWVVLKLYASTKDPGVGNPLLPEYLRSLSAAFDCRTTFHVHHALTSRLQNLQVDTNKTDQLAEELAFQYSASGSYLEATYALLHLTSPVARKASIRDLLSRHAASLPEKPTEAETHSRSAQFWFALTIGMQVPEPWIFEAKALHARSENEAVNEQRYLLAAGLWANAHECFCRRVAPRLVVDEDWEMMAHMLEMFGENPDERVGDWRAGGGIYADFFAVVGGRKRTPRESQATLKALQASLAEMALRLRSGGNDLMAGGTEEFEECVACKEMGRRVAELFGGGGGAMTMSILDLPLTADARLRRTREMSVEYYRAALVAAR